VMTHHYVSVLDLLAFFLRMWEALVQVPFIRPTIRNERLCGFPLSLLV